MATESISDADAQVFAYDTASLDDDDREVSKTHVRLCDTEMLRGEVQLLEGQGANLHAHPNSDGMWFVLRGRARFTTAEDEVLGEFGPHEGVLIPRGFPYSFESIGDDKLEVLHVVATDHDADAARRVDFEGARIDNERRAFVSGQVKTVPDPRT